MFKMCVRTFILILIGLFPFASHAEEKYYVSEWASYVGGNIMRISPSATLSEVFISDASSQLYVFIREQVTLNGNDSASFAKGEPITLETKPKRIVQFFRDGKDSAQIVVYNTDRMILMIIYLQKLLKDSP